jgi:hypothetical protein
VIPRKLRGQIVIERDKILVLSTSQNRRERIPFVIPFSLDTALTRRYHVYNMGPPRRNAISELLSSTEITGAVRTHQSLKWYCKQRR